MQKGLKELLEIITKKEKLANISQQIKATLDNHVSSPLNSFFILLTKQLFSFLIFIFKGCKSFRKIKS